MAIFFNLDKFEQYSKRVNKPLGYLLFCLYNKKFIKGGLDYKVLYGKSWLLNPESLISDNSTDPLFINQYIRLAARRSLTLYKLYKVKYLDISFYSDLNLSLIKHNPLLLIQDNKVYFKYEESH